MTVILRPYQEKNVHEIRMAFRQGHKAVCYNLPTGGGKTLTAGHMLGNAVKKGNQVFFICNRIELLDQTAEAFDKLGLSYGIIAAGTPMKLYEPIQICSIDTLKRRLHKIHIRPKLIVWDECRSLGAAGWTAVYNYYPDAKHIGLDATPIRLDGKGLGRFFTHMVRGPSYEELQSHGCLVPFEIYEPPVPDLSGLHTKMGDYVQSEIVELMDKPTVTGDAVKLYRQLTGGDKLAIMFCASVQHSENVAAQFRAEGIMAMHLDGETDKAERRKMIKAFRQRHIKVLTNCNLFSAGFDVPGVEYIGMLRPTQSLSLYLQQAGRGSRPDDGKSYCILADHAGNRKKHGFPDDPREWSLEDKKKKKKAEEASDIKVRQCPFCFHTHRPAPACPKCGHVYEIKSREIEFVDGELVKVDKEKVKAMQNKNLVNAKTYEEVLTEGIRRGYDQKKAEWFANKIMTERKVWKENLKKKRYGSR